MLYPKFSNLWKIGLIVKFASTAILTASSRVKLVACLLISLILRDYFALLQKPALITSLIFFVWLEIKSVDVQLFNHLKSLLLNFWKTFVTFDTEARKEIMNTRFKENFWSLKRSWILSLQYAVSSLIWKQFHFMITYAMICIT